MQQGGCVLLTRYRSASDDAVLACGFLKSKVKIVIFRKLINSSEIYKTEKCVTVILCPSRIEVSLAVARI